MNPNQVESIRIFHLALWVHHYHSGLALEVPLLLDESDAGYRRKILHSVPWHLGPQDLELLS